MARKASGIRRGEKVVCHYLSLFIFPFFRDQFFDTRLTISNRFEFSLVIFEMNDQCMGCFGIYYAYSI